MSFVNYKNGNYMVYINPETGDKIRNSRGNKFMPSFAENCDVTITERCDGQCAFCYAGCTPDGKHGNLNAKFLDTLHPYTELAINGNDMSHPDLIPFLEKMKARMVFVNVTINQKHFEQHFELIKDLQQKGLIKGVGVSLNKTASQFIQLVKSLRNVVIHVINGIVTRDDWYNLQNNDLDVLILGYKTTGRGDDYLCKNQGKVERNQEWLRESLPLSFNKFRTVEFDNLALEQLDVQSMVSEDLWNAHYMGDDGDFTFFINLVGGYFAENSTSSIHYPLMDDVVDMFNVIHNAKKG